MISDQVIIKESGQYDKETVQHLRLERYGISRIENLDSCISLVELNLSRNEISQICGLDNLVSLRRLDLSFNRISKLENLSNLQSLQWMDVRANIISNIGDLNCLSKLPEFTALYLRGPDGEDSNPVCRSDTYQSYVVTIVPQLEILDGGHVKIGEAFQNVEDQLEKVQPDPSLIQTPPPEPWFTPKDLQISSGFDDVQTILENEKPFSSILELEEKINSMLSEDCSHLLRKAQSALTKATKV